jgi:hypothetical protein
VWVILYTFSAEAAQVGGHDFFLLSEIRAGTSTGKFHFSSRGMADD